MQTPDAFMPAIGVWQPKPAARRDLNPGFEHTDLTEFTHRPTLRSSCNFIGLRRFGRLTPV